MKYGSTTKCIISVFLILGLLLSAPILKNFMGPVTYLVFCNGEGANPDSYGNYIFYVDVEQNLTGSYENIAHIPYYSYDNNTGFSVIVTALKPVRFYVFVQLNETLAASQAQAYLRTHVLLTLKNSTGSLIYDESEMIDYSCVGPASGFYTVGYWKTWDMPTHPADGETYQIWFNYEILHSEDEYPYRSPHLGTLDTDHAASTPVRLYGDNITASWDGFNNFAYDIMIESITVRIGGTGGTPSGKCAIYTFGPNTTETSWTTQENLIYTGGDHYEVFMFDAPIMLPASTVYILAFWHDGAGDGGYCDLRYNTTGSVTAGFKAHSYNSFPSPLVLDTEFDRNYQFWAEYIIPTWGWGEEWWGLLGTPEWYDAELWWGLGYCDLIILNIWMIKMGMFIAGLSMVFGPILYAGHYNMKMSMKEAITVLLIVFAGIGTLAGFTYM